MDRITGERDKAPLTDHGKVAWRPLAMMQKPRSKIIRKKGQDRIAPAGFAQRGYRDAITNSLTGTVQSPVSRSTGSLSSDTEPILKPGNWLQAR